MPQVPEFEKDHRLRLLEVATTRTNLVLGPGPEKLRECFPLFPAALVIVNIKV